MPMMLTLGTVSIAVAGPGDGIFVNDGTDNGCSRVGDSGSMSGVTNAACTSSDKSTQTDHSLFYNPLGQVGLGATSLTLGNELFVNGGSTATLLAPVTAGAHINTLDMRGTKVLQLANGTVSATSQDAVNGAELFNTATSTATALGGGAQVTGTTGQISAPSYSTTTVNAAGNVTTATTSANVGDALTNLSTSLANSANVGVNYDDAATKARVTFNPTGAATTLANVAAGTLSATSTEAVNGTQLNATNTTVSAQGAQLSGMVNDGTGIKYFHSASTKGDSSATGLDSVAIGPLATAAGGGSISLGNGATTTATGGRAIALGNLSSAQSNGSVAIGSESTASGIDGLALGWQAQALTAGAVALGGEAAASGNNSVALGNNASATIANSMALGSFATTTAATATTNGVINGTTYNYAGTAPVGVLSVGNATQQRQITNVAAGEVSATSTNAINGSQLNATNTAVNALGAQDQQFTTALGGGAQLDPTTGAWVAPSYNTTTIDAAGNASAPATSNNVGAALTGMSNSLANTAAVGVKYDDASTKTSVTFNPGGTATTLSNVAAGTLSATSTDAVNGSQLNATNTSVTDLGTSLNTSITNLGNSFSTQLGNIVTNGAGIKYFHSNSALGDSTATGTDSVAIGPVATASADNAIALGNGANASTANSLALGNGATTAAATATASGVINGTTYNYAGTAPVGVLSVGAVGAERQISNVAAGRVSATSTDAVNGSQLNATNTSVSDLSTNLSTQISNLANNAGNQMGQLGQGVSAAFGGGAQVDPTTGAMTAPSYSTTTIDTAGNATTATTSNNVGAALTGLSNSLANTAAVGVKYDDVNTKTSVTFNPGGTATTLSNVAAGTLSATSTDAVNGSQLNATNTSVTDLGTSLNTSITNLGNSFSTQLGNIVTNGAGIKYFHSNSALGDSTATGTDSVAIGPVATASADNAIALGNGANASIANSLALGNGATTAAATATASGVINGTTYNYAGTAPVGVLSVGAVGAERQISNVAAGQVSATSTDAVNGSQLNATNTSVTDLSTNVNTSVTNLSTQISNLANSAGNQIGQLGQSVSNALGGGAQVDPTTGAMTAPSFSTTTIDAAGNTTTATTSNNVGDALTGLSNSLANTAAVGVKYDNVSTKTRVTFNPGGTATTLSNVAAGSLSATSTDAVNGSQLFNTTAQLNNLIANSGSQNQYVVNALGGGAQVDPVTGAVTAPSFNTTTIDTAGNTTTATTSTNVGDALTSLSNSLANTAAVGVKYDDVNSKTRVTFNPGGAATTLTNVAAGSLSATSTDAVNGSQLFLTNNTVVGLTTQLNNIVNSGSSIKYFHASSSKADSLATGTDAMAVGPNAQASGTAAIAVGNETVASGSSSVALGDGAKATAAGSVAIGKGASDDQRGTETYTGKYSNASNTTAGVVSVGNATTGETRVVSNVADGSRATDAVNVRQLDGAVAESKAYTDTSLNQIQGSIKNVDGAIANVTSSVTKVEAAVTSVQNGTSGAFQVNNTRAAAQPKASGTNAVAGGMGSQASGNNSMAVGSNTVASAENATATGNGAQATAQNSVALGANSVADRENSVSVGSAGGERQITNVAAGTRGTDAANIDQVSRGIMNANINSKAYTDQRFADLKHNLKQQDDTLSAGIAGAMAMASLPRSSVAGGSMTSVAMGNYRGQSALAIGVSHVSENGRWSTNFMGTTSSQNDTGVAVGVGYQW